ncbi:MAG: hypothetical protein KDH20_03375 [Rhodocyclaceae bacterium]|nr:hypothetical protein [Rhodocyclaceae bacterium]
MQILLHIGIGKAASTTLQDWFERHPDFWPFSQKALIRGGARDRKVCVLSDERLSIGLEFDATCGLIAKADTVREYRESRCSELQSLFPDAYVLIVTRGFARFIESFHAQYVSKGGVLPLQVFLEAYPRAISDLVDYNHLVEVYRRAFGERVIVVPVELLSRDAERFYGMIEECLGLASGMRTSGRKLNSRTYSRRLRALPLFSRAYFRLIRPFSPASKRVIHKFYVRHLARGWLGSSLARLVPERFLATVRVSEGEVSRFRGLASSLAEREVYSEFRPEYLLDDDANCKTVKD